jgi:hypothetical protein
MLGCIEGMKVKTPELEFMGLVFNPVALAEHRRKTGEKRALFEHVAPKAIVRVAQRPVF